MIIDRSIDPAGISGRRLNALLTANLGSPTVGSSNDVHTSQAHASYTAAAGTQPSAPRNLRYQMSVSSTVAWASASGTISVAGVDPRGGSITETIAISQLMTADTDGMQGSLVFASIAASGITRGGVTLTSTAHAQSNNVSWFIGGGLWLGLPDYVSASQAIKHARVGTSPVAYTTSTLFSTYAYTNGESFAAANLSGGTYATNKPVVVWYRQNS
jgi:hypothetical protein